MKNYWLTIILVVNFFTKSNGQLHWTPSGIPLYPFTVERLYVDSVNNHLYACGNICNASGNIGAQSICRYDGFNWTTFGTFGNTIKSVVVYQNELIASGAFTAVNGQPVSYIAKYDGTNWQPFGDFNASVLNLRVIDDTLYAMGWFSQIGANSIKSIAKWDGTQWTDVFNFPISQGLIMDVAKYHGDFYVAGNFDSLLIDIQDMAVYRNNIWQKVGQGFFGANTSLGHLCIYKDELYVTGQIGKPAGNVGSGIQKWNGTVWSEPGSSLQDENNNYHINTKGGGMVIHNEELYVSYGFAHAGHVPAHSLAKWDGFKWCGFGTSDLPYGFSSAINFFNDTMYVGYAVDSMYGMSVNLLAKWTGGNFIDTCSSPLGKSNFNVSYQGISIYPNPTTGKFTIQSPERIEKIEIFNVLGEKVLSLIIPSSEISCEGLPEGIYFVRLYSGGLASTRKFIKQ